VLKEAKFVAFQGPRRAERVQELSDFFKHLLDGVEGARHHSQELPPLVLL